MGYGTDVLRLPLTTISDKNRSVLLSEMRKCGINV